jgi:hypothetical protein
VRLEREEIDSCVCEVDLINFDGLRHGSPEFAFWMTLLISLSAKVAAFFIFESFSSAVAFE